MKAEERGDLLRCGTSAVLHAIVDRVVDDYEPVLAGIEDDIEELEEEVFVPGRRTNPTERIYKLKREVLEMHRARRRSVDPLRQAGVGVLRDGVHEEIHEYFRDVYDHVLRANETVDGFREMLNGILDANAAQVGVRQNDDMRKISAWVAIAAVPTAIAVYGMNFDNMPELHWTFGYPACARGHRPDLLPPLPELQARRLALVGPPRHRSHGRPGETCIPSLPPWLTSTVSQGARRGDPERARLTRTSTRSRSWTSTRGRAATRW